MREAQPFNPPVIVDGSGQPARRAADRACPTCHAGPDKRRLSSGFGASHDVCGVCGYEWMDERTAEQ
jgi:uncharacterized protein (DUF983 family)